MPPVADVSRSRQANASDRTRSSKSFATREAWSSLQAGSRSGEKPTPALAGGSELIDEGDRTVSAQLRSGRAGGQESLFPSGDGMPNEATYRRGGSELTRIFTVSLALA